MDGEGSKGDLRHFNYVVIDEFDVDVVTLIVEPWPDQEELGRLRFAGA